jgi:ASC-1-like (ASCH) protein
MSDATFASTVHLTPAERYFRGEISLDDATKQEMLKMREERRETRFGALNVVIRVLILLVAIPVVIIGLLNPRRWFC